MAIKQRVIFSFFGFIVPLLLAQGILVGCGDAAPEDDEEIASFALADESFDVPAFEYAEDGLVPAWQTDQERQEIKEDKFNVRGGWHEIYGPTEAPAGPVRAVAQFEHTDGVLIAWTVMMNDYLTELAVALSQEVPVWIVTMNIAQSLWLRVALKRAGAVSENLNFFEYWNDGPWTRDYGPITVAKEDGSAAMIGNKYYSMRKRDDAVPTYMARYFDVDIYRPNLSTEGGNFMTNGEGLCAVTDGIVDSNPELTIVEILKIKEDYFGCKETIVTEKLYGEGTGHIDIFAKFLSRDTVIVGEYSEDTHPLHANTLDRNADRFEQARLGDGTALNVIRIPMPGPRFTTFRTYTNSLIVNNRVIVPVYSNDRTHEDEALRVYREAMPDHMIVPIDAEVPIRAGGAVHCTTMGFALGNLRPAEEGAPRPEAPDVDPNLGKDVWTSTPEAPIRDLEVTTDEIIVFEGGPIRTMKVEVEIEHAHIGDLTIRLERDEEHVVLHNLTGGNAQSLNRTWSIENWVGSSRIGRWHLVIEDHAEQDEGVLKKWSLVFD